VATAEEQRGPEGSETQERRRSLFGRGFLAACLVLEVVWLASLAYLFLALS
jgi:hypothetical protein